MIYDRIDRFRRYDCYIDLELRHLAALAATADEGSFGRAAVRLAYTQSTVSQQIAAFEKAVGGPVFDRPRSQAGADHPLGSMVLGQGRELPAKAEALADAVDRFKAGDGRIDIGTFQSVSNVILPSVVRRLRDEHPGCDSSPATSPRWNRRSPAAAPVRRSCSAPRSTTPCCRWCEPAWDRRYSPDSPSAAPTSHPNDRLRVHDLRPSLPPREIYLHWRAGRTHSPLARRVIELAAELAPPPASA
ncbi:LysR family transcriptional regulator [Nonomuraea jabiensis]|uniref:LysR family transcriptional regulator n=1 Tax=Nonomuraea jabiensis TaxID=882448 RepID=UPI003D7600BF